MTPIDTDLLRTVIQELRYAASLQEVPTEADRETWVDTARKIGAMLQAIEADQNFFNIAELPSRSRYDASQKSGDLVQESNHE